jgi:hypothetical protein
LTQSEIKALDNLFDSTHPYTTFHDANIERLTVDYVTGGAVLTCSVCVGNPDCADQAVREARRSGRLVLTSLLYCIIEPPDTRCPFRERGGLTISSDGPIDADHPSKATLPVSIPEPAFAHWLFINEWNAFIYLAARKARFEWCAE